MRYKRIGCAVVAFLMVGMNLLGAGRVFADEISGGDEGGLTGATVGDGVGEGVSVGDGVGEGVSVGDGDEGAGDEVEGGNVENNEAKGEEESDGTIEEDGGGMRTLGATGLGDGAEGVDNEDNEDNEGNEGDEGNEGVMNTLTGGGALQSRTIADFKYVMVGETLKFETDEGLTNIVGDVCATSDEEKAVCNVNTGEVTFNATGFYIGVYEYHGQEGDVTVVDMSMVYVMVFDVTVDGSVFHMSPEDEDKVRAFTMAQIKELLASGELENQYIVLDDWERIMEYMGPDLTFRVVAQKFDINDEDRQSGEYEAGNLVNAEIAGDETVALAYAGYLGIMVGEDDFEIGMIYELDQPVTMWTVLPEAVTTAPDGYSREFYVIRGHEALDYTATATRLATIFDGTGYGITNTKFSSFVFVYRDVPVPDAPNTGVYASEGGSASSSVVMTVLAVAALMVTYGAVKFAKK